MNFFTFNIGATDPAALHRIETKITTLEKNQMSQESTLTEIRDQQKKVFAELDAKIDRLIAAQGELTPSAQVIAEEIKAVLAAKDAENPDEEPPAEPTAVS